MTGSQEYHQKIRLLITTYIKDNFSTPKLSCLLPSNESIESYCANMQKLGTWGTDIEITAAALLLQTSIYVYGPWAEESYKWQKHSPDQVKDDPHRDECIYITNCGNHFETVQEM